MDAMKKQQIDAMEKALNELESAIKPKKRQPLDKELISKARAQIEAFKQKDSMFRNSVNN